MPKKILTGIIVGGWGMSYALLHAWAHVLIFIISAIGFVFGIFSLYMLSDKLNETRKKMLDAIGQNSYNGIDLFEGTTPLARESSPGNSLGGVDPADSGIDITGLVGRSRNWSEMIK